MVELLDTVDYLKEGKLIFRCHNSEKERLVFQIGSSDPELALQAALTVVKDVAGFDLNCGCPKKFSLQGGMGAALLRQPDLLCSILEKLVKCSGRPVSCKIRINQDDDVTISLCHRIVQTGICALTVHCRTPSQRPKDNGRWDIFPILAKELGDFPLIANGDVFSLEHAQRLKDISGVTSFMFARAAQENPSVFRKEGLLPIFDVVKRYIEISIKTDNVFQNTKYALLQMWPNLNEGLGKIILHSKSYEEVCSIFGLEQYYRDFLLQREEAAARNNWEFFLKISELYPLDNAELQERIEEKIVR